MLTWAGTVQAQNDCFRDPASPTGCSQFCPSGQNCLPSAYGCNPDQPGTCGVIACDCNCHIAFDATGPFCQGGCPDGTPCALVGDGSTHAPWECTCDPQLCPLAQESWCQALQATDCVNGQAGEGCWPKVISRSTAGIDVQACGCEAEDCGPISLIEHADGTYTLRCINACPNTSEPCVIHRNGLPWTSSFIHISQVGVGEQITCDCSPPPPSVCPLEQGLKICEPLQATDCLDTTSGDTCKPEVISVGPNGQVTAERCACHFNDGQCGPMLVFQDATGTFLSCDQACPDPTTQECHIFMNGVSTGLIAAPSTNFPPGAELHCDCDPVVNLCPLTGPAPDFCQNLQAIDCQNGQTGEECKPTMVHVDPNGPIQVRKCDCLSDECQEMSISFDPAGYTMRCVNQCTIPGQQCVIFRNGVQTNLTSIHSTQAVGEDITCDCGDDTPQLCPLPPGQDWCVGHQAIDCQNGAPGDSCWVTSATVNTAGQPEIQACDCVGNTCGPIHVTTHADGTFTYRCILTCPDSSQPCKIFRNGAATTNSSIHSSQIAPGDDITCDCAPPPPSVCPLEPNRKVCEPLQSTDCQDTASGDECKPEIVTIGPNGQVVGKRCACHFDDGQCGPMIVTETATGTYLSCDRACPDPSTQECHLFMNGVSTGLIAAPASSFPPGAELHCDCDPIEVLCPLTGPAPDFCQNLQAIDCKQGAAGEECKPTLVHFDPNGGFQVRKCDCVLDDCQQVQIDFDATGIVVSCPNQCPTPGQQCVIFRNGVQTNMSSIHSTQAVGDDITCDCADTSTGCPLPPGQDWCLGRQTLDCHNGTAPEQCWPIGASIDTAGNPVIEECGCIEAGCGKMAVQTFSDGTFAYRCLDTCPDPTQPCIIYKNNLPWTSGAIHSSQFAPGDDIRCDCKEPPPSVCPLEQNNKICEPLQATDCKDTTTGDICKPEIVTIGPNGQVIAKRCGCHFNDGLCPGPIIVANTPNGTFLSCDLLCQDPASQQCVIFMNGMSTGQISAPATAFPPGAELWCDCDPINTDFCPLAPGPGNLCNNLQFTDCKNGQPGQDCSPTIVNVTATGGIEAKQCDCMAGECQEMAIIPDPAGFTFRCVNQCPVPPGGNCVIHLDGNPTTLTTIHSTQTLGHSVSCDCAQPDTGACCYIDATGVSACASNVTAAWCAAVGGTFHLSATCTGNQACCKPDGTCEDLDPLCCADVGGVSQGAGTTCSDPGICGKPCLPPPPPETQWCSNHLNECQDSAPGEECKPIAFTKNAVGGITPAKCACLLDDCQSMSVVGDAAGWTIRCDNLCDDPALDCVIHRNGFATTMTSIHSTQFGASDVITCDCAQPPLVGACCYYDAATGAWNCQDGISSADCEAVGGVFHPGQNCTGLMGCCLPDGTCQMMDPLCCDDAGGVTLPAGAICTGQTEACCDPATGVCTDEERECCLLHGGIPQGAGTNCGMPGICQGDICPLAPGEWGAWCNNFQSTDCVNGKDTEECWPAVVQVDPATGFPLIRSCDCMEHCGPVTIAEIGGTYQFHCEHQCELPGFECVIHYNGASQGLHAVNATDVPPGTDVTCDCAPDEPDLCPVPPQQPWCEQRQDIDCPQMSDDERCMPRVVSMTTAGTLNVEHCECQGQECGPVLISQQPDGYLFRCPQLCDDPALKCLIHFNGVPQGVTYVHSNAVPANADVTCDCNQVEVGMCCYLNAAGVYDCIDGVTAAQCPGTFHPNQTCTDSIVPCCLPDGTCQDLHPLCCQDFGGTPNPNQMCTGQTVACCDPVSGDCQNMDSMCCATPVPGGLCTGDVEACCLPDGTCSDLERLCCYAAGGAPQGVGTSCSDPGICQGDLCDLPTNAPPWCEARQPIDCKDGQPGEDCKPSVVSIGPNNQLQVVQCDCQDGDCGPVNIVPVASGYIFRCPGPCPDGSAKCRIHRDGVPTSVSQVHSSTVAPGEQITCDCVDVPQVCPLDPQLDICLERQQLDCKTTAQGEFCKAKVVSFTATGNPFAKACDCFQNDGLCGPVLLFPAPPPQGGWNISCDQACPKPGEQCVIWRGNSPTGLVTAHSSMFAPDENLSCGCNPVVQECKPTPDGQACTPCPDPTLKCVPTQVQWTPGVPGYRITECRCTNKCHINPPPAAGGEPFCSDACPNSPFSLLKKCVKKQDPATGAWICRCVPIIIDLDPADPTLLKNRYLSMTPGGSGAAGGMDSGPLGAIRITLNDLMNPQPANPPGSEPPDFSTFEGEYRWAGSIGQYPADALGNTFNAAGMSCDAMFLDYSVLPQFSIFGAEALPSSSYSIQTVSEECSDSLDEEECYSDPVVLGTGRFGDVASPFQNPTGQLNQPGALDIGRVVDVVKAVPGSMHKTLAQLQPNVPNPERPANAMDIAEAVDSAKGKPYHMSGPCVCPSTVVCNPGTACTSNTDCTAPATCVNGFCSSAKDACGRCTAP